MINSQPHSPPAAAPRTTLSVSRRKEETMFQWKFPVTLWGNTGAVLRREHLGRLDKLSDIFVAEQRRLDENYLKRLITES